MTASGKHFSGEMEWKHFASSGATISQFLRLSVTTAERYQGGKKFAALLCPRFKNNLSLH